MKLERAVMLLVCLLVVAGLAGCSPSPEARRARAIAEIKKLGAKIEFDEQRPGKPVVTVDLDHTRVTDAGLVHLKELTNLEVLHLDDTGITGSGLVHLKGLTNLHTLTFKESRQLTDAGLKHLKGLTGLKELRLDGTQVTDTGLEHLKALTGLESLKLKETQVTDEGIKRLQEALPNCKIHL